MAVSTAEPTPFVVLDDGYRIAEVGSSAEAGFAAYVGHNLWDCFPDSEPVFRPHYDTARRTGEVVEFVQYYDAVVVRVKAVPLERGRLAVYWEAIGWLDFWTLDGLLASLREIEELLARAAGTERQRPREHLRVVGGAS